MTRPIYYRKLYQCEMIERWKAGLYTSFHRHGEPPEWILPKDRKSVVEEDYPLGTFAGKGRSHPSARKKYIEWCVVAKRPWKSLSEEEKWATQEQDGVFASDKPDAAYWYGGEPEDGDMFVAFYGTKRCDAPDANSVLVSVDELLTESPLTPAEFVNRFCDSKVPSRPVADSAKGEQEIKDQSYKGGGLVGDDQDDGDYGEMPTIR